MNSTLSTVPTFTVTLEMVTAFITENTQKMPIQSNGTFLLAARKVCLWDCSAYFLLTRFARSCASNEINERTASPNKFIQCTLEHVKGDTDKMLQCRVKAERAEGTLRK